MKSIQSALLYALAASALALSTGCETDSADTFIRDVSVNYTGFYRPCDGSKAIVQHNSGNRIRTLDLRQNGDRLEAVDNNGNIWRGSLGEPQGGRSSFELRGRTSTGVEGVFSGILSSSDAGVTGAVSSVRGTMTGTYIEPDRFSPFCGTATIPGTQPGGGGGGGGGGTNTNVVIRITSTFGSHAGLTLGLCCGDFLKFLRRG
ncbi:MAG: hypothetical protein NZ740_03325 [Kiritimatiellae bacterium]|nr:hypothetical protein [Kiritimatiellia bacterium]MDW8458123.1 hypothetical protein [Verrucomicrobiota bacterium]